MFGLPCDSNGKESAGNVGDPGLIPGSGRSPGEENGNPLQYSCLENSVDREVCQATVHGVSEWDTTERLTLLLLTYNVVLVSDEYQSDINS